MDVKLTVGGEEIEYNIQEELYFDIEYISKTLEKHAGELAWWSSLLSIKEKELADKKVEVEGEVGRKSIFFRTDPLFSAKYNKKVTEGVINAELAADEELMLLHKEMNELRLQVGYLKAMSNGMDRRTALLATSGSIKRSELEAGLRSVVKKTKKQHS